MKNSTSSTRCVSRCAVVIMAATVCLASSGCANRHYDRTEVGELKGKLVVEWRKPDSFVFIPSMEDPLRFTRASNDDVIKPKEMWTDGGSIPRPFWVFKNYSPWGYGPAFIIHDWLFHMQYCELPGFENYDVKLAAAIMSEVMKTLMENPEFDYGSPTSVYLMYKAVQTAPAKKAWEDGECVQVRDAPADEPDKIFEFSF